MTAANSHAHDERGKLLVPETKDWIEWTSVEDFLEHCPDRYEMLIDALDLDHPGLAKVKEAVEKDDKAAACEALLTYYAGPGRCEWMLARLGEPNERHLEIADGILERRHHKGSTVCIIPEKNGAWDWNFTGPKGNREFAYNLNRHPFFSHLYQAYRKTGDEKYAQAFDRIVRDWILHTVYPGKKHEYVWTWRVLEAGLRMRGWTVAFHGFLESDGFTPAGRLLMLSSFVQHGRYIRMHHWKRHNHALMEHDGLNRIGLAFPELKEAEGWHRYALKEMLGEMDHQVYPDGAHDELSSGYHWVSLKSYEEIDDICRAAGREVPQTYRDRLVEMYDYWAGLVRPDLSLPQNNRSDRSAAAGRLLAAAEKYNRPDWRYIDTNGK
ncbi:MAG: heparinase II/III family protein, partial [Verrucomicrobiota bacterium]